MRSTNSLYDKRNILHLRHKIRRSLDIGVGADQLYEQQRFMRASRGDVASERIRAFIPHRALRGASTSAFDARHLDITVINNYI